MVVVVTGAGTVVCWVVVVVLRVAFSVPHPVSDTRAAAATQERINFIIDILVVWFVILQAHNDVAVAQALWGVTLPGIRREK